MNYRERQAIWVKSNNIKVGDRLKISQEDIPDDWNNSWESEMTEEVGCIREVIIIAPEYGIGLGSWSYPYTSLQKVDVKANSNIRIL